MRGLFWLSDQQWAAIEPHLPYYAAGKRRQDAVPGVSCTASAERANGFDE